MALLRLTAGVSITHSLSTRPYSIGGRGVIELRSHEDRMDPGGWWGVLAALS